MKKLLLPFLIASFTIATAQTPCDNGMAGSYPCNGYDLQSHFSLADLNAQDGNDSWGWTDPQDGKEYALMGLNNGTAFIDISDPINPVYLGKLPTHTSNSSWRDIKVYNNYAFVVSEASGHGMQVFDLTKLRSVNNPPETFTEDAHYGGFGHSHNIVINEDTGYAYSTGDNTYSGGAHFINIQDPLNPVAAGGYSGSFYTHDAQVIVYNGPDSDHTGKELFIGANENEVVIVDVTNKNNPQLISNISYSNDGYTHQVWLSEDRNYIIVGDELDEQNLGFNTRTIIIDINDLDNPSFHFEYYGTTPAIDHNGYSKNGKYYLANYKAGMRVMDISDLSNSNMSEVGYFDTYPANNNASFNGVWNVYPYFGSGNIVISDISGGFFVVKSSAIDNIDPVAICQNYTAELDANGQVVVAASSVDGGSSDDSGSISINLNNNTFDCSDIGTNSVTLTVTDPSGNTDTCTAIITVVDNLAPVIDCPSDINVAYDAGQTYFTLPDYVGDNTVTATDNCNASVSITQTPISGTQLPLGDHDILFETEDSYGNASSCSFTITVVEELSTSDFEFSNGLSIYPNPSNNEITIESKFEALTTISIFDISGKQIYLENTIASEKYTLDISSFSKGIYFITLNKKVTKKIVKI
jgi:choice-of-anchor B domain-containing protein